MYATVVREDNSLDVSSKFECCQFGCKSVTSPNPQIYTVPAFSLAFSVPNAATGASVLSRGGGGAVVDEIQIDWGFISSISSDNSANEAASNRNYTNVGIL